MSKRKPSLFARVLCVSARSGIVAALYLAAFLSALGLAAVLPESWSAVGITALVLVAGLAFRGKWPGRGYQPDGKPNPQPAAPALPKDVPARSRPALDAVLDSR